MSNVTELTDLDPIQRLALSKIDCPPEVRTLVDPGSYNGKATFSVAWGLNVGNDYEQNVVQKAPVWGLLHLALSKLNGTTLESLLKEYMSNGSKITKDQEKAMKDKAKEVIVKIKGKTKTVCFGKVTATITIDPVSLSAHKPMEDHIANLFDKKKPRSCSVN